jgi:hypothetical protein
VTEIIDHLLRGSDKQFLLQSALKLTKFKPGNKIIVQNKFAVEKFTSTLVRYVAVNCKIYILIYFYSDK